MNSRYSWLDLVKLHAFLLGLTNDLDWQLQVVKLDLNKLPCRFCSIWLHIRNRETSGYLLLAGDDDNPCRLNAVRLCPKKRE
jgi:hypothetical protein